MFSLLYLFVLLCVAVLVVFIALFTCVRVAWMIWFSLVVSLVDFCCLIGIWFDLFRDALDLVCFVWVLDFIWVVCLRAGCFCLNVFDCLGLSSVLRLLVVLFYLGCCLLDVCVVWWVRVYLFWLCCFCFLVVVVGRFAVCAWFLFSCLSIGYCLRFG